MSFNRKKRRAFAHPTPSHITSGNTNTTVPVAIVKEVEKAGGTFNPDDLETATTEDGATIFLVHRQNKSQDLPHKTPIIFKWKGEVRKATLTHLSPSNAPRQIMSLDFPPEYANTKIRITLRLHYEERCPLVFLFAGPYTITMSENDEILRIENKNARSKTPSPHIKPNDCGIGLLASICQAVFSRPLSFI